MSLLFVLIHRSCRTSAMYRRLIHTSVYFCHANAVTNVSVKHCYAILNVSASCSSDELRDAYLSLVKKYHPDSISGHANANKFAQVEDAYRHILVSMFCVIFCVGLFSS